MSSYDKLGCPPLWFEKPVKHQPANKCMLTRYGQQVYLSDSCGRCKKFEIFELQWSENGYKSYVARCPKSERLTASRKVNDCELFELDKVAEGLYKSEVKQK